MVPPTEPGAEQRALRTAQGLDPVEVEQIDIGREQRQRDHRLVEIDPDLLLDARLVADDLAGRDAAHRHLALAGAEVLDRQAGDVARQVFQGRGAGALDVLLGLGVDRERHVQNGGVALGGGDDDLSTALVSCALSQGRQGDDGGGERCRGQQRATRAGAMSPKTHGGILPDFFSWSLGKAGPQPERSCRQSKSQRQSRLRRNAPGRLVTSLTHTRVIRVELCVRARKRLERPATLRGNRWRDRNLARPDQPQPGFTFA
jgi:hypothetical protein